MPRPSHRRLRRCSCSRLRTAAGDEAINAAAAGEDENTSGRACRGIGAYGLQPVWASSARASNAATIAGRSADLVDCTTGEAGWLAALLPPETVRRRRARALSRLPLPLQRRRCSGSALCGTAGTCKSRCGDRQDHLTPPQYAAASRCSWRDTWRARVRVAGGCRDAYRRVVWKPLAESPRTFVLRIGTRSGKAPSRWTSDRLLTFAIVN